MIITDHVREWLLDADPSLRWQVLHDLLGAPADEVAKERARVATEGLGAHLLALQSEDGTWGGAAWNRGCTSTLHALMLLRDLGLDPNGEAARHAVDRVQEQVTWRGCGPPECDTTPFFAGEVEPCINGQVALRGLEMLRRSGVAPDERVTEAVDLVALKRDADGRWPLELRWPGEMPTELEDGVGRPNRWITLRALRVLAWALGADDALTHPAPR
jgi:hypothetical protein